MARKKKSAASGEPSRGWFADRPAVTQALVLSVVALVVRGLHLAAMRDSLLFQVLNGDAGQYDLWARQIAGGEWLGSEVFYQTPLYPYLLAIVYSLFGPSAWVVRAFQACLGAAACVLLARAGARFFSERVGWIAGLILALYPPAIFFDALLQKSSLDLFLMTVLLWLVSKAAQRPHWALLGGCGVVLAAMALNRENAAVLVPVLLAWILWISRPRALAVGTVRAAVFVAGMALVLLPVGLRNYYVGNVFLLTTSQMGPNFYIGNRTGALGTYAPIRASRGDARYEREDARLLAEAALERPLTAAEISDYRMERTWRDIQQDPTAWLRLLGWKWFLTWNTAELVDNDAIEPHARQSPILAWLGWFLHFGVLCPAAVLGIWFTRHDWRRLWVLYAMLLAFAAAVTLFYVFARYRYPLVPPAALFAGAGLGGLWDRVQDRYRYSPRELWIGVALATAAAVICNWPYKERYDASAITYYSAASLMLDQGRTDDAVKLLKMAEKADATLPETYNELGVVLMGKRDFVRAQKQLEHAVSLSPQNAVFQTNLATALSKRGDMPRAVACLNEAIRLDPLFVDAHRALGEVALAQNRPQDSVGPLERAIELQPGSAVSHVLLSLAFQKQGQLAGAVEQLRRAVELDKSQLLATNNLAWILATAPDDGVRNGREAVELADQVCRATQFGSPELLGTLAAAYAEAGQFPRALEVSDRAVQLAEQRKATELVERLKARRQLYVQSKAFRDPELKPPGSP